MCFRRAIRNFILKIFGRIFSVSTGFCLTEQWLNLIKKNCFSLIDHVHNQSFFDEAFFNYNFDFEENYFKLIRQFRHMSLFLICLHFLRYTRSCDRKSNYCRVRSIVREKIFFNVMPFQVYVCARGTYLHLNNSHRIDLDVFLLNTGQNLEIYTEDDGNCSFFQIFMFPQELFAAFSALLVRKNSTIKSFSNLLCQVSLSDERTIIQKIIKHALTFLGKFWHETNYQFFYEFLICLIRLILAPVIQTSRVSLNLVHIILLRIL